MLGFSELGGSGSTGFLGPVRRRGNWGSRQDSEGFLCTPEGGDDIDSWALRKERSCEGLFFWAEGVGCSVETA